MEDDIIPTFAGQPWTFYRISDRGDGRERVSGSVRLARGVTFALFFAFLILAAVPAWGHSFLVDTRPGQGERLDRSPSEVVFQFTEAVAPATARVEVATGDGAPASTGGVEAELEGRVLRVRLAEPVEGVAVVSWQVVSALDGHASAGELAFAVGASGTLPAIGGTQVTATGETVWRWLLVAGLSIGAGSLIASANGQIPPGRGIRWARLGLAVAAVGPAIVYLGAITGGLSGSTMAAGATALVMALAVFAVGRGGVAALALVAVGVLAWASRSHATTAGGALGTIADATHLAGAALWFGTLTLLVFDLWQTRIGGGALLEAARRYSRWALRAVVVLAAAGLVSALTLLTTVSDLWTTNYGWLLLIKVGLFGVALALAIVSRWRALRSRDVSLLRILASIEVVVVAGIVATSGILAVTLPPALAQTGDTLLGPPPIEGPTARAAGLAGNMTVGAHAGDGRLDLLVYNSSTGGIRDARIEATATLPDGSGLKLQPRPCGTGCFTQQLILPEGTTSLTVTASSEEWTAGTVQLDLDWPPPPRQPELLEQVLATMRNVEELTLTETVDSGPGATATNTATFSGEAFLAVEVYAQGDIEEVTRLPGGEGIRLYLPGSRILIDFYLDAKGQIVSERIVSPGHEITRTFSYDDP